MDGPEVSLQTHPQLSLLVRPSIKEFIWLQLTEHGWFSTDEDNTELAAGITELFFSRYLYTDYREVFHTLFDGATRTDFAREISTRFLSLDPAPNDPSLRSFVTSIFSFYQDLLWKVKCLKTMPKLHKIDPVQLVSDESSANSDARESMQIANPEGILSRFFEFPAEIRDVIYKEALIAPEGALVRSFTPPPLLCASRRLRDEALPLFYKYNHFEITVKRSRQDELLAAGWGRLRIVDMRVWRSFLDMWNVFNAWGTNGLQYVERVTVIYQLSVKNGMPFGSDSVYDRRVGFRFSRAPIEENVFEKHGEGENAGDSVESDEDNNSDSSHDDSEASDDDDDNGTASVHRCHEVALNRGTFGWPSRKTTERFLFERIREYRTDKLWDIHPLPRLANMLWRCARDCPQATENVNFVYRDFQHWTSPDNEYGEYDDVVFHNPDDDDDWRP